MHKKAVIRFNWITACYIDKLTTSYQKGTL